MLVTDVPSVGLCSICSITKEVAQRKRQIEGERVCQKRENRTKFSDFSHKVIIKVYIEKGCASCSSDTIIISLIVRV